MNNIPVDLTFPAAWRVEVLYARPLILPPRHFVYPREVEEVERGALELMIHPGSPKRSQAQEGMNESSPGESVLRFDRLGADAASPFLATCAVGFRDPAVPTGVWSTPDPKMVCALSGGYAYVIDSTAPERFMMIPYRPVMEVRAVSEPALLLFVGHRSILAWGAEGQAWESEKLSDEGVTVETVQDGQVRGRGWEMMSDREVPFTLDLSTGRQLRDSD